MLPIHAQGCKVLTKLCTTFTEGCCKGLNRIEGNWKLKGKIKEKWGHLTDDDLDKIAGRRAQLRNATLYAGISTTVSVRACE